MRAIELIRELLLQIEKYGTDARVFVLEDSICYDIVAVLPLETSNRKSDVRILLLLEDED